jgi:hypothetical protein
LSSLIAALLQDPSSYLSPGEDFRPAATRISRTPLVFQKIREKQSGQYDPSTKSITVDPFKADDIQGTIRHESIHALLDRLPNQDSLTTAQPGYSNIAAAVARVAGGNPAHEVPAYLGSAPNSQIPGIPDSVRNSYMGGLVQALFKLDPALARKITQLGQVPQ